MRLFKACLVTVTSMNGSKHIHASLMMQAHCFLQISHLSIATANFAHWCCNFCVVDVFSMHCFCCSHAVGATMRSPCSEHRHFAGKIFHYVVSWAPRLARLSAAGHEELSNDDGYSGPRMWLGTFDLGSLLATLPGEGGRGGDDMAAPHTVHMYVVRKNYSLYRQVVESWLYFLGGSMMRQMTHLGSPFFAPPLHIKKQKKKKNRLVCSTSETARKKKKTWLYSCFHFVLTQTRAMNEPPSSPSPSSSSSSSSSLTYIKCRRTHFSKWISNID